MAVTAKHEIVDNRHLFATNFLVPAVRPAYSVVGKISSIQLQANLSPSGSCSTFSFQWPGTSLFPAYSILMTIISAEKWDGFLFTTSILAVIIIFLEFLETQDRVRAELNEMFQAEVPIRRFKTYSKWI